MPDIQANGLRLHYEEAGDGRHPPLLLIMGLGSQLILWPDELCEQLVDSGYRVIRFDNRDVGLSEKLDHLGRPNLLIEGFKSRLGLDVDAPYTLRDMAADAVALMDALELNSAHVIGASMGGMIAQIVAALNPERTRSLTSIMSSSGDPDLPQPGWRVSLRLVKRPESSAREDIIRFSMDTWRMIGSPGHPEDEQRLYNKVARHYDRSFHPPGFARQMAAVLAADSRVNLLQQIKAPTLVIHGEHDPLVPVAHGHDTARHIPNADKLIIDGMGHDLPLALIPRIAQAIDAHVATVEQTPDTLEAVS